MYIDEEKKCESCGRTTCYRKRWEKRKEKRKVSRRTGFWMRRCVKDKTGKKGVSRLTKGEM